MMIEQHYDDEILIGLLESSDDVCIHDAFSQWLDRHAVRTATRPRLTRAFAVRRLDGA